MKIKGGVKQKKASNKRAKAVLPKGNLHQTIGIGLKTARWKRKKRKILREKFKISFNVTDLNKR